MNRFRILLRNLVYLSKVDLKRPLEIKWEKKDLEAFLKKDFPKKGSQ